MDVRFYGDLISYNRYQLKYLTYLALEGPGAISIQLTPALIMTKMEMSKLVLAAPKMYQSDLMTF